MELYTNIDLLFLGMAIAGIATLGFMVYFSEPKSSTARAFLFFSIVTIIWGIANYISYQVRSEHEVLVMLRVVIAIAVWHAFSLFHLVHVYPREKIELSHTYKFLLIPIVAIISFLNLSPYVFTGIEKLSTQGASVASKGPGMFLFALTILSLTVGIFYISARRILVTKEKIERRKAELMFFGIISTFALLAIFNFSLPALFDNTRFIPYGAAFVLPTIIMTSYAILRHRVFSVKVFATGFLTATLSFLTFLEIIYARGGELLFIKSLIFIFVLIAGVLLVRGVNKEVEQREEIQKLAGELQIANDQQSVLIHFITHQIKGFFTMSRNIFSLMLENTFGELNPEMRRMVQQGFDNTTKGVTTVQEVLSAANIKNGTVKLELKQMDLKALLDEVAGELKPRIDEKKLQLGMVVSANPVLVMGDHFQLHEVFKNLIDNAIRYTPKGTITVTLQSKEGKAHFSVKDSGVGISEEDKKRLFTEGGRGKDSLRINVDSTGFGLFIVKNIVDKHEGRVWAESEGIGKGSTFLIELPLVV